jgi:hypothetical protein
MKFFPALPVALTAALLLAACAPAPGAGVSAPAADLPPADTAAAAAKADEGLPAGPVLTTGAGPSESEDAILFKGPDGEVWIKSDAQSDRGRDDVESCYTYAQAQIDHDVRIDSDRGAAFESSNSGLGLTGLRGRMRNFEQRRRRPSLFNDCMVSKGYTRG